MMSTKDVQPNRKLIRILLYSLSGIWMAFVTDWINSTKVEEEENWKGYCEWITEDVSTSGGWDGDNLLIGAGRTTRGN